MKIWVALGSLLLVTVAGVAQNKSVSEEYAYYKTSTIKGQVTLLNHPTLGKTPAASILLVFQRVDCPRATIATWTNLKGEYEVRVGVGQYRLIVREGTREGETKDVLSAGQRRIIDTGSPGSITNLDVEVLVQFSCNQWQSLVDPQVKSNQTLSGQFGGAINETPPPMSDEQTLQAIECLLKLKGLKHDSRWRGATRLDTSSSFGPASVEVVALYFVSYLYLNKWGHAGGLALINRNGELNRDDDVATAFDSYEKWFAEVKKVGLSKAREMDIQPLLGTRVQWY